MFTKIENKCSKQQEQFLCLQAAMLNVHIYTFINMCQVSTLLSMLGVRTTLGQHFRTWVDNKHIVSLYFRIGQIFCLFCCNIMKLGQMNTFCQIQRVFFRTFNWVKFLLQQIGGQLFSNKVTSESPLSVKGKSKNNKTRNFPKCCILDNEREVFPT